MSSLPLHDRFKPIPYPGDLSAIQSMKILAFIPLGYCTEGQFWQRDLGLVILALRDLGHEAFFVALGATHEDQQTHPLLLVDYRTASDPAWWSAQHADMIIINTWSATRHQHIRSATLST